MSRSTIIRAGIGISGFAFCSALLIINARPDQRPWTEVIVALLIVGCLIAIYAAWRRRRP